MDYKEVGALRFSLSERYKIMQRRLTGNCKRHQDMVTISIKQSRAAALIPYTVSRKVVAGSPFDDRSY